MTKASASCFLENLRVFEDGVCALVGCLLGSVGGGVIVAGGVPTARAGFLFALGQVVQHPSRSSIDTVFGPRIEGNSGSRSAPMDRVDNRLEYLKNLRR
jgi:hypothetical protein